MQSYAMAKVLEEERVAKEQRMQQEREKADLLDKKKQYADKVKDIHKPAISSKKRLEL